MYVDKNLQVALNADVRAASLVPTGVSYIYLSNTIQIGNGTRGMPIGRSVWTVNVDTDLAAATPPCSVDFKVISGDNGDDTFYLFTTDAATGTVNGGAGMLVTFNRRHFTAGARQFGIAD